MRLILLLFLIVLSNSCFVQKFVETTDYYVEDIDSTVIKKYWEELPAEPLLLNVALLNNHNEKVDSYILSGLESYAGVEITKLENHGLKNIKEIIHVRIEYNACCSNYFSHYYLVTMNSEIISLPEIDYLHCDGPTPINEYIFPAQEFGLPDRIIFSHSQRNDKFITSSIEPKIVYTWTGKKIVLNQ